MALIIDDWKIQETFDMKFQNTKKVKFKVKLETSFFAFDTYRVQLHMEMLMPTVANGHGPQFSQLQ